MDTLEFECRYFFHNENCSQKLHNWIGITLHYEQIPCTMFAIGMAPERNPEACAAIMLSKLIWKVASHGYRWWDYQNVVQSEREHIRRTVQIHKNLLGKRCVSFQHYSFVLMARTHIKYFTFIIFPWTNLDPLLYCSCRPVGMYQGKRNKKTRRLVVEEGGFLYDSDSYADDLPYWTN